MDIIGLSSTAVWSAKQSNSAKICKIRAITPLKVIQGHRLGINQKLICDFLVINTNSHPLSLRKLG